MWQFRNRNNQINLINQLQWNIFHVLFVFDSNWRIDYILIIVCSSQSVCIGASLNHIETRKGRIRQTEIQFLRRKLCECRTIGQFDGDLWFVVSGQCEENTYAFSRGGWVFVWYDETTLFQHHRKHSKLTIYKNDIWKLSHVLTDVPSPDTMRKWENSI